MCKIYDRIDGYAPQIRQNIGLGQWLALPHLHYCKSFLMPLSLGICSSIIMHIGLNRSGSKTATIDRGQQSSLGGAGNGLVRRRASIID